MDDNAPKLSLYERESEFFQDPDCMKKIFRHVANGGSVIDLAKIIQINYCDIMHFIRSNPANSELYEKALMDRKEWAAERALKELHDIVETESEVNHEGVMTKAQVRDRLKAVELLGKTQALFTDRVEKTTTIKLEDLVLGSYQDEEK
jgi:hypothetical protein